MPIEPVSYRDNIERIVSKFPNKELLTKTDVAKLTGLTIKTVSKRYPFNHNYISIATLARHMS